MITLAQYVVSKRIGSTKFVIFDNQQLYNVYQQQRKHLKDCKWEKLLVTVFSLSAKCEYSNLNYNRFEGRIRCFRVEWALSLESQIFGMQENTIVKLKNKEKFS